MFDAVFIVTYSLKVKTILAPLVGTIVVPGRGDISTITGGMVSLRPPEGACVVFAHPQLKKRGTRQIAAAIRGMYFFIGYMSVLTTS